MQASHGVSLRRSLLLCRRNRAHEQARHIPQSHEAAQAAVRGAHIREGMALSAPLERAGIAIDSAQKCRRRSMHG